MEAVVKRAMDSGFYEGVNFNSTYCNECRTHSVTSNGQFKCPHCGSSNITTIARVCGYLGYSNVNGQTRFNDAKMAEVLSRKSM